MYSQYAIQNYDFEKRVTKTGYDVPAQYLVLDKVVD